jgi:beta-mannosidase
MSEYGLQAMPTLSTIRAFQAEEEDFLLSPSLKCHQKHPTGYENINAYLEMENMKAENLEDLIYKSQLVQAKGIGLAIEAHRRAMPYCMGTLYWQLNDCWPVTSWSGTDVFGNRKALQYRVRELFKDILVTVIDHKGRFEVHLISDRLKDANGQLEVNAVDFAGNRAALFSENISALANTSRLVISENSSDFFAGINKDQALFEAIFTDENGRRYVNQKFLATYGSLKLPEANITKTINAVEDGYNITLRSDAFAAHVQLYLTHGHAIFSNNFLHLLPNEEITIFCKTDVSLEQLKKMLMIKHL